MLEISSGAVIFTHINNELKYVIIHDNNNNYGFPKGHQEKGESLKETALREIKEEVGIDVEIIGDFEKTIYYSLPNGNTKEANYYLAYFENQELKPQEGEVQRIELLSYKKALDLINFEDVKDILISAHKIVLKDYTK